MKKIILSLTVIAAVAAVVVYGTGAFFSDTEVSTGNTFTAGAIDLTVDSTQHYNGMVCTLSQGDTGAPIYTWQPEGANTPTPYYPAQGDLCDGTWLATDLGAQTFFNFSDLKPGDFGENTISLHINNNDAWLRLKVMPVTNNDNSCTEPELTAEGGITCGTDPLAGELRQNLLFNVWLDWGMTPGFQGGDDTGEGDNIRNYDEPILISEGTIDEEGEVWDLADWQGQYLSGGDTAYFGIGWRLPTTVGNEVQTDSMGATMEFQVEQYRNNPNPFQPQPAI